MSDQIHFAIDGNEANVKQRVGSNVYAFHILQHLAAQIKADKNLKATVLLAADPIADLPQPDESWSYQVITPVPFWTQLALPLFLYQHRQQLDLLFTPGHYAPRFCPLPYVSSVMDLAFLHYPQQFKLDDRLKLKLWTNYSVRHAEKIVTISQFSQQEIKHHYQRSEQDILVAYPDVSLPAAEHKLSAAEPRESQEKSRVANHSQTRDSNQNHHQASPTLSKPAQQFFDKFNLSDDYFLFIGTLQPRKNLIKLIQAYQLFYQEARADTKNKSSSLPLLVIAGKIGWLARPILEKAQQSPLKNKIIFTNFVPDKIKPDLYQQALATVLVGLYEGFGIPPLESMHYNTIPIVSRTSSLPEVVGQAGLLVNPHQPASIAQALKQVWHMPDSKKRHYQNLMQQQIQKFSWQDGADKILKLLIKTARSN